VPAGALIEMDAAAAHSKAVAGAGRDGSGGNEEVAWRRPWPGWRRPGRVEVVVTGFLATSTLLLLAFGGAGNQPAFSSSPGSEFVQKPGTNIDPSPVDFGSSFGGAIACRVLFESTNLLAAE